MKKKDKFWKTVAKCARQVKKWPKWKQRYIISAETAMNGRFLK